MVSNSRVFLFVSFAAATGLLAASKPLNLIHPDETGTTMVVTEEGLAFLRSLGEVPLAIVAVAGPARSGKSFFINALAQLSMTTNSGEDAFPVGHGVEGYTKGIWVHSNVLDAVDDNGKPMKVLFMDTEGFSAGGNIEQFDPKLCFLTSIFASTFYYNVLNSISMDNVRFLNTVASLNDVFMSTYKAPYPAPPVTWLVQSFELDLSKMTPPNAEGYLNSLLTEKGGLSDQSSQGTVDQVKEHNSLLKYIRDMFHKQSPPRIFTLPHPKPGVKRQLLESIPYEQLDAEYQDAIAVVREVTKKRATPKHLGTTTLTGSIMAQLLPKLAASLNDIKLVGPALVMHMARILAEECYKEFKTNVATLPVPAPPSELEHELSAAKATSLTKFDTGCVGGPNATENEAYRSLLVSNMTSEAEKATSQNQNVIVAVCQETLRQAEEDIRTMYDQNIVSLSDFDDKVQELGLKLRTSCGDGSQCSGSLCLLNNLIEQYKRQIGYLRTQYTYRIADRVLPAVKMFAVFAIIVTKLGAMVGVPFAPALFSASLTVFIVTMSYDTVGQFVRMACSYTGACNGEEICAVTYEYVKIVISACVSAWPYVQQAVQRSMDAKAAMIVLIEGKLGRNETGVPVVPVTAIVNGVLIVVASALAVSCCRSRRKSK